MSNPTSNFGWQMPTSTDLVTDLPADFEVFGQAVDTSLADLKGGTTGQVLKKNSNTDMDFVWSSDATGMTNPMTTTGDTIYSSSGSTPARLGIGTTGQILTVSGGLPVWATPSGGGKIAQVVSSVITTSSSSSSTSFVDVSGFSLSITPTNASSKILVLIAGCFGADYTGDNSGQFSIQLVRNSTSIFSPNRNNWWETTGSAYRVFQSTVPLTYLDSPATTSATTYKLQFRNQFGGTVNCNNYSNSSTITLLEVLP